ncbi:MAG: hypothetical protein HY692_08145, partial [Cyanobacteria bacterium NC_groundwater_1444_Ag_S-0.65um_54_12]|nr:hypothetical protein [Cyanobacteria bacterium NC_groundwater_1444_Ag_S-0.65um_54_12]
RKVVIEEPQSVPSASPNEPDTAQVPDEHIGQQLDNEQESGAAEEIRPVRKHALKPKVAATARSRKALKKE